MATIGTLIVHLGIDATDLRKGEKQVESSFGRMEKLAKRTAATIGGIFAGIQLFDFAKEIVNTADTMKLLEGRLKLVTDSNEQFADAQKKLFDISNKTRTAYEGTLTLYARMARAARTTGTTQEDMLRVTESVSKALIVSGASTAEAQGALVQLSQGLAANALRGQEMNSVLEQIPRVAQLVSDGLEIGTASLRDMGAEGELTAKKVIDAILSQTDIIDQEFKMMPKTVGQSITVATNHWQKFVAEFDKASGMTDAIIDGIYGIVNAMKGLDAKDIQDIADAMHMIGSTAEKTIKIIAAYYALFSGPAVIAGIGNWVKSMYSAAQATMQVNSAVAAGDAVMLNSAKATAMKAAAEAESAAVSVRAAQAQVARTETDIAAVQAKIALINAEKNQIMTLIYEGRVTSDVTALEQKFVFATRQAAAAQIDLRNATTANTQAQAALSGAMAKSTASTEAAAVAAKNARASMISLNTAVNALFAAFIGWEIGKWLTDNFEWARVAGIHFVDDTIKGFYELERIVKIVIAGVKNGWSGVFDLLLLKQAKTNELMAKGLDFISKDVADRMREIASKMRGEIGKGLKDEKIKIDLEFDEKMADRARIISQMLAEASDEYTRKNRELNDERRRQLKILQDLAKAEKQYREEQDALIDRLLPLQTLQREYKNDLQTLEDWYKRNSDKAVEYQTALENLNRTYAETRQSIVDAELREVTEALNKEYEERIKNEQMLQDVMSNRLELEKGAVELAVAAGDISGPEAAQQMLDILNQELAMRQQLHDQVIGTSAEAELARQEQLMQIQQINMAIVEQQQLLQDSTWIGGMKAAWAEYSKAALDAGANSQQFFMNTFSTIEDALVSAAETGKLSFEDMAKSILADLLRIQIRALLVKSVMAFASGGGGGLPFHGGMDPSYRPPKFHNGMSPSYQPPRLHNGLKPDEFPAILQTGERVTSRRDVNDQNRQLADYERWKMNGGDQKADSGVSVSVPITLDPSYSKKFRSEMQSGIESTVMDVIRRLS